MDVRIGKFMEERPLGHAMVQVSELCTWSDAEQLPYDFQQMVGDFRFVQAEFLFPIVSDWSTQHLTPEAAQGIMAKLGKIMGGRLVADDPHLSGWAVRGKAHNAFERLFYQAVKAGKLRLLDGITRMPIQELTPESLARFAEVGGDADTPTAKVEAVKGITKGDVMAAFQGMKWDYDHWGKNLASPPDWLIECRVAKGSRSKKASALWNPVLIAIALLDKQISIRRLDAVFVGLKDWADEWQEASALFRV